MMWRRWPSRFRIIRKSRSSQNVDFERIIGSLEAEATAHRDKKLVLLIHCGELDEAVQGLRCTLGDDVRVVTWALQPLADVEPLSPKLIQRAARLNLHRVVAQGWHASGVLSQLPRNDVPVLGFVPSEEVNAAAGEHRLLFCKSVHRLVVRDFDLAVSVLDELEAGLPRPHHPRLVWLNSDDSQEMLLHFKDARVVEFPPVVFRQVARYHLVEEILRRPEVFRDWPAIDPSLNFKRLNVLDGQDHKALRSLVQPLFTPKGLGQFEEKLRFEVRDLLSSLESEDTIDADAEVSGPLNLRSLSVFTGLPVDWLEKWEPRAQKRILRLMPDVPNVQLNEIAFFRSMDQDKRDWFTMKSPRPGSLLEHLQTHDLSDQEVHDACGNLLMSVLVAGVHVTREFINQVLRHLKDQPEVWHALCARPEVLPVAIEEFLRIHSTSEQLLWTRVRSDFEIQGEKFNAGENLQIMLKEANRDPEVFANGHEFRLDRPKKRHLAFGIGAHHCLGAWLVRTQVQLLLEALMNQPEILDKLHVKTP